MGQVRLGRLGRELVGLAVASNRLRPRGDHVPAALASLGISHGSLPGKRLVVDRAGRLNVMSTEPTAELVPSRLVLYVANGERGMRASMSTPTSRTNGGLRVLASNAAGPRCRLVLFRLEPFLDVLDVAMS